MKYILGDIELKKGWKIVRADVVLDHRKTVIRVKDLVDLEVFHYSIPSIQECGDGKIENGSDLDSDKILIQGEEILVSKLNPEKGTIITSEKKALTTICSTELVPLVPGKEINIKFAFYFYSSDGVRQYLSSKAKSATKSHKRVDPADIYKLSILLPDTITQEKIVSYLDREIKHIDLLIIQKERFLTLLFEKRNVMITQTITKGLNPKAKMKNSGIEWLGDIPVHWKLTQLKYLSKIPLQYGANEAALDDNMKNPRFVRITDINDDGNLRPETFKSLEYKIAEPYLLEDGDILFARSGATVGKSFMYQDSWGTACFAGYLIRMRCDKSKIIPNFLNFITQSQYYWDQVNSGQIQATIQNFSGEKYGAMKILQLPLKEQEGIVQFLKVELKKLDEVKSKTEKSIELLKEKRVALITAAVTGQLLIP